MHCLLDTGGMEVFMNYQASLIVLTSLLTHLVIFLVIVPIEVIN
jgi:hypothetical protein